MGLDLDALATEINDAVDANKAVRIYYDCEDGPLYVARATVTLSGCLALSTPGRTSEIHIPASRIRYIDYTPQ